MCLPHWTSHRFKSSKRPLTLLIRIEILSTSKMCMTRLLLSSSESNWCIPRFCNEWGSGLINFTSALLFGEKLNSTDPEDVMRNALACFAKEATGTIQEDYLRELLATMGSEWAVQRRPYWPKKKEILITLSSHAALNMGQNTKMIETSAKTSKLLYLMLFPGYFASSS